MKRFPEGLFSEKWYQMESQIASKRAQHLTKNELETKSTKHIENVLNLILSDLRETRFRMEELPNTKTRGADKYKTYKKKNSVEMKSKFMKKRPQNSTKNDA